MERGVSARAEGKPVNWRFCLWALRRRLPFTVGLTILSLVFAAVYGLKEPKFYEASTLVRLHEETPQGSPAPQAEALDLKTG